MAATELRGLLNHLVHAQANRGIVGRDDCAGAHTHHHGYGYLMTGDQPQHAEMRRATETSSAQDDADAHVIRLLLLHDTNAFTATVSRLRVSGFRSTRPNAFLTSVTSEDLSHYLSDRGVDGVIIDNPMKQSASPTGVNLQETARDGEFLAT